MEVQGRRALSRVLKRQNNCSYFLFKDLRFQDSSSSGSRLKRHFRKAERDENHRLNLQESKRIAWITRSFNALDGDRDGNANLEELWIHQR